MLRVRERAGERDLEACVGVLVQVHKADGYPVNWPALPADWLAGSAALGAWVAELDGRIVGHVALARSGAEDVAPRLWSERAGVGVEGAAVVSRLFVAPDARGHGIGALLMGRAVRESRARGLHPVLDMVSSELSRHPLRRLGRRALRTYGLATPSRRRAGVEPWAAGGPALLRGALGERDVTW